MSCLYAPSALPKLDVKDKVKLQLTTTLKFTLCGSQSLGVRECALLSRSASLGLHALAAKHVAAGTGHSDACVFGGASSGKRLDTPSPLVYSTAV